MAGIILNRNRQVPAEETPAFGGIAERFRRAGDLDRAIALCREGLKRFPDQLSARVTLGWSFLDKGQYDAARFELEQVLRKAPDNLAAIRGLAELHDRTEGALPSEDERSWRSEGPVGTEVADARPLEVDPEPDPPAAAKTDAPLHVTLGHRAPEILHTAAHAEMAAEAAASVHVPLSLDVAPVELEGLADASMAAAANEPAQFFVVDPTENFSLGAETSVDTAPAPFEVIGPNDREASELADVASLIEHGLDADADAPAPAVTFDAGFIDASGVPDAGPITTGTADDDATLEDWAALAALSAEADAAAEAATAPVWDDRGADTVLELAATEASALEDLLAVDANQIAVPESLDDIDELAGQDIADAIKGLEDAARRVEARFAIRPALDRPAASNEEIAAFDFGRIEDTQTGSEDAPIGGPVDTSHDGSFELIAPDLANLAFADRIGQDDASDADERDEAGATFEPAFDFERSAEAPDAASEDSQDDVYSVVDWSVAEIEPPSPGPAEDELAREDVVAQAAIDADSDLLLASPDATGVEPVDDMLGSLSVASGTSGLEADPPQHDLLGSMALHDSPGDIAADLSAHDTASDDVVGQLDSPLEVGDASDVEYAVGDEDEQSRHAVELVEASVEILETPDLEAIDPSAIEVDGSVDVDGDVADGEVVGNGEGSSPAVFDGTTSSPMADAEPIVGPALDTALAEVPAEVDLESETAHAEPIVELVLDTATAEVAAEVVLEPEASDTDPSVDADAEELPLAALVGMDPLAPGRGNEAGVAAAVPVTAVYDAPVFVPFPMTAIVEAAVPAIDAALAAVVLPVGAVKTLTNSPLHRLERFLRQVQARQVELRGETVA